MPPTAPKLRTKAGCVNCRERRKKCDERKPVCNTCERLGLRCHWPDRASLEDRRERMAPNSRWSLHSKNPESEAISSLSSHVNRMSATQAEDAIVPASFFLERSYKGVIFSAQIFGLTDRESFLLTYYCNIFIPANILPKAHAKFSKLYIGQEQELRDSMFACSSIQLANMNGQPPIEALNYYTRAISGLRRRLDVSSLSGKEEWVLAVTVLLHCFETWRCDAGYSTPMAIQHLLGAIKLLKLHCLSPSAELQPDLYVLMAESVIFHVSTLLISSLSLATLEIDIDLWEWIEVVLQTPAYEDALAPANHPVLGTPRQLNKLIFEISKLSAKEPLTTCDLPEKQRLERELSRWEIEEQNSNDDDCCNFDDPYKYARLLYILCARILLLRLNIPGDLQETVDLQQKIRNCRARALSVFGFIEDTSGEPWNFLMKWPLQVLGYAAESDCERDTVCKYLTKIWDSSACGDVKRSLDSLQRSKARMNVSHDYVQVHQFLGENLHEQ